MYYVFHDHNVLRTCEIIGKTSKKYYRVKVGFKKKRRGIAGQLRCKFLIFHYVSS